MSAATLSPIRPTREAALRRLSEHLRGMAEAIAELALCGDAPGPHLVAGREPEQLLSIEEAAAALGSVGRRTVHRFARRHPEVVRHVGARVKYERGALLRATRKG